MVNSGMRLTKMWFRVIGKRQMDLDHSFREDGQEMSDVWAGPEVSTAALSEDSESMAKSESREKSGRTVEEWQHLAVAMVADHILPEASQRCQWGLSKQCNDQVPGWVSSWALILPLAPLLWAIFWVFKPSSSSSIAWGLLKYPLWDLNTAQCLTSQLLQIPLLWLTCFTFLTRSRKLKEENAFILFL